MRIESDNNKIKNIYDSQINRLSRKEETSPQELSQDRVEFSRNASKDSGLSSVKNSVAGEVERGTSPDKLRRLRSEIQSGSYRRSSSDIADAMLGE